jgi:hypothetical protein
VRVLLAMAHGRALVQKATGGVAQAGLDDIERLVLPRPRDSLVAAGARVPAQREQHEGAVIQVQHRIDDLASPIKLSRPAAVLALPGIGQQEVDAGLRALQAIGPAEGRSVGEDIDLPPDHPHALEPRVDRIAQQVELLDIGPM